MTGLFSNQTIQDNLATVTEYDDLTSSWYEFIGYQIWFNMLIDSLIPHLIMPIVLPLKECVKQMMAKK